MPELGTSGAARGRDGQPPGLLDLQITEKASCHTNLSLQTGVGPSVRQANWRWRVGASPLWCRWGEPHYFPSHACLAVRAGAKRCQGRW